MNQMKFVWLSNNIPGVKVEMGPDGITTVHLRPLIDITHNSKMRDLMLIEFKDNKRKYIIPDQKTLEEIYRMHMENTEVMYIMNHYCEDKLPRATK